MKLNDAFTKMLAIGGTVLVWLPLLAPVLFGVLGYFGRGSFTFDFLMPAELFLIALAGTVLLLWAAMRAHDQLRLIGVAAAVAFVVMGLLLISPGGMPGTWMEMLVFAALAIYALGLAVTGAGGALLIRDLFRPTGPSQAV